ncbi:MAG: SRPBCC domain-containing protein [Balneola sp.]|nr:SRPBCC domain-containing protein [Balneola sp.]MBO6651362.1 SRPBCC domain-containing protein [Balneola sp.]MBO6711012.1 SRPBCC domain-containing protein [Balneola sp.]MBO6801528.1 SRPBCC domain-containing protein [Balneola sp.]MBO6870432.1 SRPBCC domain-containing protein [Balneola sp.]
MKKIHSEITINASPETVWNVMLEDDTYRKWTSAFAEGSHYEGSWKQGEKMLFLDPEGTGMVSIIAELRPHEFISLEHIGIIQDGIEDTESEDAKKWAPAFENYTFEEVKGKTKLSIDMDILDEFEEMFTEMWKNALKKLKVLSENV